MATSRGGTPANPTLVATTDDAARGGLFARSNTGNLGGTSPSGGTGTDVHVVSGVVQGTNLILTLSDQSTVTITDLPSGGTSPGGNTFPGFQATNVTLNGNDLQVTFADGTIHTQSLSGLMLPGTNIDNSSIDGNGISNAGSADNPVLNLALDELTAVTSIDNADSIAITDGTNSERITFADFRSALNITTADINVSDFESDDNSVIAAAGSAPGRIDLVSRPVVSAQTTLHPSANPTAIAGGVATNFAHLAVNLDIGGRRVILIDDGGGRYTLELEQETVTPPGPSNPSERATIMGGSNVFEQPPNIVNTINISNGTVADEGTDPATNNDVSVTVTRDGNPITTTPMVMVTNDTTNPNSHDATVVVTIPGTDASQPGDYEVTTMINPTDNMGMRQTTPLTNMNTVSRIIPYVEFRGTAPTTASDITSASDISTVEWPSNNEITISVGGTTAYYLAVNSAENLMFFDAMGNPWTTGAQYVEYTNPQGNSAWIRAGLNPGTSTINVIEQGVTTTYNIYRFAGTPVQNGMIRFR